MKRLHNHTFEQIIATENLLLAWQEFVVGKRYKSDVARFGLRLFDNIELLHQQLAQGLYRHGGYYRFTICDPKLRTIHKASVRDRLLHHAIYRVLYPFFDRTFCSDVFSSRVGKGTHAALQRFARLVGCVSNNSTRTCWVLKCDIKKFFGSIDHQIFKNVVVARIDDVNLVDLISSVIDSFNNGTNKGLPLGNLTSQLFCNVYMDSFDEYVKHQLKVPGYIRYADDFVVLSSSRQELLTLLPQISNFLSSNLKLRLHPQKVSIKTLASGVDFLGWVHFPHHRVLRTKTKQRILRRSMVNPAMQTIASYRGLLRHGHARKIEQELVAIQLFAAAVHPVRLL
ncbi:MAG: reverse transcriptase/maturase family protein [Parcubacteria group bacterium]